MQGEPTTVRVGEVTAVAWPAQAALAAELARAADGPHEWPGLGRVPAGPLSLIVVPDRARLDSLTGGRAPAWGIGLALPDTRTILLRADVGDLHRTLRHELAHLALHERVRVRVPLWFDEGYATWAAGEWERLGGLELNLSLARGAVPSLPALDAALRSSAGTADAAYGLATTAVAELARLNPTGTLVPLLTHLQMGDDFAAAVQATTGLSLDRFEERWQQAVRTRYSWATWLLAGGGWALLGLAVLWFGRLRRRRDASRRAALDHDWVVPETADEPEELDPGSSG
jgi:hypothetical protein